MMGRHAQTPCSYHGASAELTLHSMPLEGGGHGLAVSALKSMRPCCMATQHSERGPQTMGWIMLRQGNLQTAVTCGSAPEVLWVEAL